MLISAIIFQVFMGYSQTENQRKYAINDAEEIQDFILSSGKTQKLSTHFHSKDSYYDLYIDTPDFLLKKERLSLRFRKRISGKKITYGFQLKSEMDSLNSVRMEVEETELDFYQVKSKGTWISLTEVLDTVFKHVEKRPNQKPSENVAHAFELIDNWIQFKAGGAIAPFQKLLYLKVSLQEIQSLAPVTVGKTVRKRSHIYATSAQSEMLELKKNRVKADKIPTFFKKNKDHNWLLESSLDQAIFYPLYPSKYTQAQILEYEVENKYYLEDVGVNVLNVYEQQLRNKFGAESKLDSKYQQALQQFEGRR